ncbi:MAG: helicase-exonuclease AddAB subunit AddA [Dethiobacter sp.]|nr:helicase-exonuclease AddAB subunit AddA [Dethiobacter sp.]MBS3901019.1 helicase-exonuclease AddAB subunit AddA [Dethiobacter sp.]MBS3990429.1 helicase-exonuclease AddAB subunit AddA [Dethiobacter sp.]
MNATWTDEQLEAITATGANLLVAAAAGAGKTAVLVERIVRIVCDRKAPVDIDRLLVVTFTEAAAAEMRERIGAALEQEIRDSGRLELGRQLALVNGAPISTLHSFCLAVIRRYFYMLEIDPGFRVADEAEASMLRQDVATELLEQALAGESTAIIELVSGYGGKKGADGLGQQILRLYSFAWSNPDPLGWLKKTVSFFEVAEQKPAAETLAPWLPSIFLHLLLELAHAEMLLARASSIICLPGGPVVYEKILTEEREQAKRLMVLAESSSWEKLREAWLGATFNRLPAAKGVCEEKKEQVKELRDKAKAIIRSAAETFFIRTSADYLSEIRQQTPLVAALAELTKLFAEMYDRKKRQIGLVDFNDLEHFSLQILWRANSAEAIPSDAALELRQQFIHVLVDEYQDINPVQDAILALVSRQGEPSPNLFMVGDVKQSIYRFRMGEPALFLKRYSCYPTQAGGSERKILLSKNFRCRAGVVSAVNFLFRQLMIEAAAEIEYNRDAELIYGADYPEYAHGLASQAAVEVHLLPREQKFDNTSAAQGEEGEEPDGLELEALVVAQRIKEMLDSTKGALQIFDQGSGVYRSASYRDMVILLRATSNRANRLIDILGRFGIPAYADLSTGYFAATEVETMLSLLKVLDNPCQDIALAAVLRSPLVGLSLEELALVRITGGKKNDFFASVNLTATAGIPLLSEKLQHFLSQLERWRNKARQEKLTTLIAAIYRESGYADYVAGLSNGAQRQANLHALFSRARQFDRFSRQGLFRFLEFIAQLRRSGEDLGSARALAENENVVRIMSIHKSKGLEFPIVFLCDLGKNFNFLDQRTDILIHKDLGIAPLVVDTQTMVRYPSLPYLALKLAGEAEVRAEEMRILYVALTRAREKLLLIASARNLSDEQDIWRQLLTCQEKSLPASELVRAKSYLDWLGCALIRHQDMAGAQIHFPWLPEEDSRFDISIWNGTDKKLPSLPLPNHSAVKNREDILALRPLQLACEKEVQSRIRRQLSYRYPHTPGNLPAKLSISELLDYFPPENEAEGERLFLAPQSWHRPSFLQTQKRLSTLELGILYHRVFQHLRLLPPLGELEIAEQIAHFVKSGIISEDEANSLNPAQIAPFFTGVAGDIVFANANQTYREWPFTLLLPAKELASANSEETVLIQGIIDLLVKTEEGYVLVDFKTDKIPQGGAEELAKRYKEQLGFYARAVETILAAPVKASYLYLVRTGETLPILL